jgi:hypothetical protein
MHASYRECEPVYDDPIQPYVHALVFQDASRAIGTRSPVLDSSRALLHADVLQTLSLTDDSYRCAPSHVLFRDASCALCSKTCILHPRRKAGLARPHEEPKQIILMALLRVKSPIERAT